MVVTTLEKITDCKEIPYAQDMIDFISEMKKNGIKTGRHDIHGDDLFAAISEYETEPVEDRKFENHRKYIDLQILLSGSEEIHWAPVETLNMTEESFSEGGDIAFYEGEAQSCVVLHGNTCAILYENDAHKPNVMHKNKEKVIKVVFKIKISE